MIICKNCGVMVKENEIAEELQNNHVLVGLNIDGYKRTCGATEREENLLMDLVEYCTTCHGLQPLEKSIEQYLNTLDNREAKGLKDVINGGNHAQILMYNIGIYLAIEEASKYEFYNYNTLVNRVHKFYSLVQCMNLSFCIKDILMLLNIKR